MAVPDARFRKGCVTRLTWRLSVWLLVGVNAAYAAPISLFDGKTLNGWEGDSKTWRVENGAITGGSLTEVPALDYTEVDLSISQDGYVAITKLPATPSAPQSNTNLKAGQRSVPKR